MTDVQVRAGSENAAEYQVIARSLNRVRRRLWFVRAGERAVVGLAWGAAAALFFVGARLVVDWSSWVSVTIAAFPVVPAAWMWREARKARGVVANTFLIRIFSVLTVLLAAGTVAAFSSAVAIHAATWAFAALPLAVFAIAGAATVRAVDAKTAAIFIDQQVGLKERVSTALDFLNVAPASPMEAAFRQPVLASAVEACNSVGRAKIGYARADQRLYATAATVAIAAVAVSFLTPLPAAARTSEKQYAVVVEKGKKLEKILEELAQKPENSNEEAKSKLKPLKTTLAELKKGNISPFEAEERLSEERADLQKTKDEQEATDRVEKALDNIKDMEQVKQATDDMKKGDAAHADGQSSPGDSKDGRQAMKDATGALGNKLGGMSKDEKDKLAKGLEDAAKSATGAPDLKDALNKAAESVRKNDGGGLASNLNQAGESMSKGGNPGLSGQALKDAMDAIDRASAGGHGGDEDRAKQGTGPGNEGNTGGQAASSQQQGGGQQGGQQGGGQQQMGQQGGGQQNGGQQGGGQRGAGAGQTAGGEQGNGKQNGMSGQGNGGQEQNSGGGSTNLHAPSGPGEFGEHAVGRAVGGSESYVRVYDEQRTQTQGETEKVSGQINPLAPAAGTIHVLGQGEKSDPTIQTYNSQLPAARKRAMDDLQTQQVPPQYRDLIREYYNK